MSKEYKNWQGNKFYVSCNYQERPVVTFYDLPPNARDEFDYVETENGRLDFRFFQYRGSWYDLQDGFEMAGSMFKALGFDGIQTSSFFDGIVVQFFDKEGVYLPAEQAIVAGHAHW